MGFSSVKINLSKSAPRNQTSFERQHTGKRLRLDGDTSLGDRFTRGDSTCHLPIAQRGLPSETAGAGGGVILAAFGSQDSSTESAQ